MIIYCSSDRCEEIRGLYPQIEEIADMPTQFPIVSAKRVMNQLSLHLKRKEEKSRA